MAIYLKGQSYLLRRHGSVILGKLQDWCSAQDAWVGDALRRAASAGVATPADAEAIALRVQAANGIAAAGSPECLPFDERCLAVAGKAAGASLLCSIGPLRCVDRLAPDQELKFGLNGLTIVFGENGSGKSGYARAARRLCTSRVPITLQCNVFEQAAGQPTVTFSVKSGEADPVTHQWIEGSALPDTCAHMNFLDTANALAYVEDKTEILFLPPEVRCLTTLGELYSLAAQRCEAEANQLSRTYGDPVGVQFDPNTTAGKLVGLLTTATTMERLPSAQHLREAATWNDDAAGQLSELRIQIAAGPATQARALRRLGEAAKAIADKATGLIPQLGRPQINRDAELVQSLKNARAAAEAFAAEQAVRFPIAATGSDTWRELFRLARKFAAEADIVPEDGSFDIGDPCVLCQRPLNEAARDRLIAFDAYVAGEAAAAVAAAKSAIDLRVATSLDHQRIRRVASRFAAEAASGRQVIIFTHNLLFYQEVLRACADRERQVSVLPCLIQQSENGFGLVSVDDQPWIAKKVRERERMLHLQLQALPDNLASDSETMRRSAKQFYTDLRETWERAVEEVVLGGVVERFGTDVKTLSLKRVDIDDADYRVIFFAMKRASELSGHDQAAAKQIDPPSKKQMELDLLELRGFIAMHRRKAQAADERRKELEQAPRAATA